MVARRTHALIIIALTGLACLMPAWARPAVAQAGRAEVTGCLTDSAGAVIPGALVTLLEPETNGRVTATTAEDGCYALTSLRPGVYQLAAELEGFKRFVREGVALTTGERVRIDVTLELGGLSETVTVAGDAPLLRTESGSLGQVITSRTIVALPLNGRSFVQLTALAPGVALPPGSALPRINGGRPRTNEYLFDGISVLQPEPGQVAFLPIVDAIQEFKVETNSPPAEFGRFNGGVVNLTTRAGTNTLHGTAFEFFRHEALNARNLFAPKTPANPDKPLFRRDQFGFVAGGPILPSRTFFFSDYQATRQRIERVRVSTVPTLLQRNGVFTEPVGGRLAILYDPATTRVGPDGQIVRDPFPNNSIPPARVDPVAAAVLNRYPLPTAPGTANNYRRIGREAQTQHQVDLRIDHVLSSRARVFGRFSDFTDLTIPVTPLPDGSGTLTAGAIGRTDTRGQSFASSYGQVFSDRVTNELRFGYTRRALDRTGPMVDAPLPELGLVGIPTNAAFQQALPTFAIDGLQPLGSAAGTFSDSRTDVLQIVDVLSVQRNRHLLKAGVDLRWSRLDIVQPPSPTGSFRFSTLFTDLPGLTGTGSSLASFLLGQVQSFTIDLQQKTLRPRAMTQEYFVQDDWHATRRLTVNAGLRYTLNFPSTEVDNQGAIFNLASQQLDYLGQDGFPRSGRTLHGLNLGPRLGVAYRAADRTVMRAGYGLVWIEMSGITTPFINPYFPFLQTVTQRSLDNINTAFQLRNGPSVVPTPPTPDAGLGQGVFTVDRDLGSGYVQQWNVSIQRELGPNLAFELGYTGSTITHVGIPDSNINQLTVDQLRLGAVLQELVPNPFFGQIPETSSIGGPYVPRAQLLRPYPRFTTVSFYRNNVGKTHYHGVQAKIERRFSRGHSFLVCYTRSKLLDDASSVFDAAVLTGPVANYPMADSFNRRLERDVSTGDVPNNFVAAATYQLPDAFHHAVLASLFNQWAVAGVVTLQSGLPLAVTQATNFNAFAGFGTQRPNRRGDPELPANARSAAQFFDTSAFTVAPPFTTGTSSRNPVRGPASRNLDLALIKRVPVGSRIAADFRVEAFNVTNTPPLAAPNTVLGSPGFGSITAAGDPRVVQLALKLTF